MNPNRARTWRRRCKTAGFTLIELMVVLAVLGVLTTLALSSFQWLTRSQRVKNAGFELFASLTMARSEAIKRNGNVTITPAGNWANGWTITAASGETIKTQPALAGIVISGGPSSVVYARTGRLPSSATTAITFQVDVSASASEFVRCIRIELSGMPRTARGACS